MLRILRRILPGEPVLDSEWAREARIAWNEACLSAALDALPALGPDDTEPCRATDHEALEHPPRPSPAPPPRIKPWRERLID
jgi:hypothetical protein